MSQTAQPDFFSRKVLGHPAGLFVLFFTEMWERFSFYGMRVLLINFLTMTLIGYNPGWGWSPDVASSLFGTYAMLLYITPIAGGVLADKYLGYRNAVVIGALIMTLGHACMALENSWSLYVGLGLLVIGTGFFKPNITSIISQMYKDKPDKKDGAYTIFYMGVNAGAFFGMLICGYLAERVGWSWGFGLAGIFMLLGTLQFWLSKPLFGSIGDRPVKLPATEPVDITHADDENVILNAHDSMIKEAEESPNPFTTTDKFLIVISSLIGLMYAINDPLSQIAGIDLFSFMKIGNISGQLVAVFVGLVLFLYLVISRILRYSRIVRDRMFAVIIFAFFTVFFWMSFEQGASSLVIFARDNINRVMEGNAAMIYNILNTLLIVVPLILVTYVLYLLGRKTGKLIPYSNAILVICFAIIWGVVFWMQQRDFETKAFEVSYPSYSYQEIKDGDTILHSIPVTEALSDSLLRLSTLATTTIGVNGMDLQVGDPVYIINKDKDLTEFAILDSKKKEWATQRGMEMQRDNGIVKAQISKAKQHWIEITVSWFSILNSFFIIVFASMVSKLWDSKYNPPAAVKYGLGLIIMAIGFGLLAWGSYGVSGVMKVSMIWLILAYLFHTLGELFLSPVGLSYVSKLVPPRMIALMFGMWYLAIAIGNKLAAVLGGEIEEITKEFSLSYFFLIFTIVPTVAGIIIIALNPVLKKLMHGVK